MDIRISVVSGCVVEVGKFMYKCSYPKIENIVCFSLNIEILRTEMEKLTNFRDDIKETVEGNEGKGYKPKPDVLKWIKDVRQLEIEWKTMQESIATTRHLRIRVVQIAAFVQKLKEVGESFGSNLLIENYQMKKVEFIPVCIIGVYGMGGVGKTTLVKNLNNELLKIDVSKSKLSFGVVIWITMPKTTYISMVQAKIADRLNLKVDGEGSEESNASKIYQRLKEEKSFLLILDDVWEAIDLDHVGVPQPQDHARSKVMAKNFAISILLVFGIGTT
ncbi:hypothetical protein H5410_050635 [Solanum commersonii]|uniref:NB-ARC domain-containing protein n=1 Tax=Solanum commersonii TaxID=4109 RepID=A0A9J5WYH6_SOLCO|nr:hypothetical protein H5410_050635 [Solanum commersonii]